MINLYNSQITDIVPSNFKKSAEIVALSYAVQRMNKKLIEYARKICIFTALEDLSEEMIDLLAAELRTQYYTSDLDIEIKRNLVSNTLMWYMTAGTPAAVEELVKTVFGTGNVIEWFNDTGTGIPGTFDVQTYAHLTLNIIETFKSIIKDVKNTRSHLNQIYFISDLNPEICFATGIVITPTVIIHDSGLA